MPAPQSLQFQMTVTSLLFQPVPFATGDWEGAAVGGLASVDSCASKAPMSTEAKAGTPGLHLRE